MLVVAGGGGGGGTGPGSNVAGGGGGGAGGYRVAPSFVSVDQEGDLFCSKRGSFDFLSFPFIYRCWIELLAIDRLIY